METIEGNFQIHCGKKSTKMSDKKHALLKIFFLQKSIRDYLKPYGHGKYPGTSLKCRWEDRIDKQNWCHVSRRKLIDWTHDVHCSRSENFGFALAQPCIILKPTKIFDWEPEPYYNITEVQQLPQMPKRLKNEISKTWEKYCKGQGEKTESKCPRLRMVWVTCEGETLMDTEYMGPVHLTPMNGFPGKYFPFVNQNHYLSPLISIQFRNLTPGVLVSVVCKLWAKNIRHDTNNPFIGGTRFELRMN